MEWGPDSHSQSPVFIAGCVSQGMQGTSLVGFSGPKGTLTWPGIMEAHFHTLPFSLFCLQLVLSWSQATNSKYHLSLTYLRSGCISQSQSGSRCDIVVTACSIHYIRMGVDLEENLRSHSREPLKEILHHKYLWRQRGYYFVQKNKDIKTLSNKVI